MNASFLVFPAARYHSQGVEGICTAIDSFHFILSPLTYVVQVVDGVFIADIFIQFFRGFYRDSVLVTDLKEIYQSYISGKFLFDATAAMPLSIIAINASPQVQAWLRLPKVKHQPGTRFITPPAEMDAGPAPSWTMMRIPHRNSTPTTFP